MIYLGVDTQCFRVLELGPDNNVLSEGILNRFRGDRLVLEAVGMLPAGPQTRLIKAATEGSSGEFDILLK